tara:strand:+ start:287 stop:442 length:156 start_codon:yes stop_codon:yes gene_type:complete
MNGQEFEEVCDRFSNLLDTMEEYGAMGEAYKAVEMAQDVFMGECVVLEEEQ